MKLVMMLVCSLMVSAVNAAVHDEAVRVVKMASRAVLRKNLYDDGFAHFAKNSPIIKRLAGYWLSESQARLRAKRCIATYSKKHETYAPYMEVNEPVLLKILLQDFYIVRR